MLFAPSTGYKATVKNAKYRTSRSFAKRMHMGLC